MHEVLERNLFFVKEHVGIFKAANNFDILDPDTQETILHCREPKLGVFTKMLRFTDYKRMTPFDVRVTTPEGDPVVSIHRGVSIFLSKVDVRDESEQHVGGFKQKLFSIGGKFEVLDASGNVTCMLEGKVMGWDFKFSRGDHEIASVSKKWAGIGKELFTSADNYILKIDETVAASDPVRQLILASVLCIDMVLKE